VIQMQLNRKTPIPNSQRHPLAAALLALLLTTLIVLAAGPAQAAGQVGEPAADFTLQDSQGGWHTLSDQVGTVVVLFMVGYG